MISQLRNTIVSGFFFIVSGCASQQLQIDEAEQYAANEEWLNAVLVYRKASANAPGDIEFKSRLKQTELKAADYYYQKGIKQIDLGSEDGAVVEFQQGLVAMPDHSKLNQAMKELLARQEANRLYDEATANYHAERTAEAKNILQEALKISPDHAKSKQMLEAIEQSEVDRWNGQLALTSEDPITLNFSETDLKLAFEFIAKSFGVNVVFDDAVKDTPVTLFAQDVTFEQAINLLLMTTKTFFKEIGVNTVLVAPDTREKRDQYNELIIKSFALRSIPAKEMASILKGILGLKTILANDSLNTVIVRADMEILRLAEKIITINDRKPAELILDVEILEVNRTKAEQIGLDIGSQITVTYGEIVGSISKGLREGVIKLPPTVLRFYKQDVDAKTLANPKVRVINGKPAKIHIGDRVPLRSSTIQDATGQTRTTFEYKDIGIKLTVEPDIHLDNSVTVKMGLEVSTLGQNLGTQDEPAFSIGTRNADTSMLLRDGETAILGGLIRDEDRNSEIKVPGLGDIPVLGSLFTTYDDQRTRTDVLLTITPRIVRAWDLPPEDSRSLFSGTRKNYSTKPMFAYLKRPYSKMTPAFSIRADAYQFKQRIDDKLKPESVGQLVSPNTHSDVLLEKQENAEIIVGKEVINSAIEHQHEVPLLGFKQAVYETTVGGQLEIGLIGQDLQGVTSMPLEILYNPRLLTFTDSNMTRTTLQDTQIEAESDKGLIRINMDMPVNGNEERQIQLIKLYLSALKPGTSYLVYRSTRLTRQDGTSVAPQLQTARVNVK
ncbi:MAG: secretin N-terminal domain-containing protein [Candidatus Thiodiazotropha endolucinida]